LFWYVRDVLRNVGHLVKQLIDGIVAWVSRGGLDHLGDTSFSGNVALR
jgi:hypothetical protein